MGASDRQEDEAAAPEARLLAARQALRAGVDRSRALGRALARDAARAEVGIRARLPAMEASARPIRAPPEALASAGRDIDRALGPAAAVLKVFDAVHGLEAALLARGSLAGDLPGYLAVLAQLEAALRLLADNCGLAAQWLADIVAYLGERDLADPRFVADLASLDAGHLAAALGTLEAEFGRHLAEHSALIAMKDADSSSPASVVPSRIPASVVHKLGLILDRLDANGRLDRCSPAPLRSRCAWGYRGS